MSADKQDRHAMNYRCIVADPPWSQALGGTWTARVDKRRRHT